MQSPKRRLIWSPETPSGRPRKYSIGEAGSPKLRKGEDGVIEFGGRVTFPSLEGEINDTIDGLKGLKLPDDLNLNMNASDSILNLGVTGNSPTLKLKDVTGVKDKRRRKSKKIRVLPGQKLLTEMMGKGKVGGVKNTGNDEEENSGGGREEKD